MKSKFGLVIEMKRVLVVSALLVMPAVAQATPAPTPVTHTPYDRVHRYIVSEYQLIHKDVHAKKLTAAQGKALMAQVKAVQTQEKTYVKANGSKTLTDTQANTLTQQLEAISKTIPVK